MFIMHSSFLRWLMHKCRMKIIQIHIYIFVFNHASFKKILNRFFIFISFYFFSCFIDNLYFSDQFYLWVAILLFCFCISKRQNIYHRHKKHIALMRWMRINKNIRTEKKSYEINWFNRASSTQRGHQSLRFTMNHLFDIKKIDRVCAGLIHSAI